MAEIWPLNRTDQLDMWIQAKLKLKIRKTNLKGDTDLCSVALSLHPQEMTKKKFD